jgi:metallophosphoesterase (TIGR00282 family)
LKLGLSVDLVIANGENAAGGIGLTPDVADELFTYGIDAITTGNHIWSQSEIIPVLESELPVVRPLNYPVGVPGKAITVVKNVAVVSLMGRTFLNSLLDCPFRAMDRLLAELAGRFSHIIVDFHAEATSEKQAMSWYLDGRVTAVVGTHTHVGTIDNRVLPTGTATVADIGMVGPKDSVIGDSRDDVLKRFLTGLPNRLSVGKGRAVFNSVLITTDEQGKALTIDRIDRETTESI